MPAGVKRNPLGSTTVPRSIGPPPQDRQRTFVELVPVLMVTRGENHPPDPSGRAAGIYLGDKFIAGPVREESKVTELKNGLDLRLSVAQHRDHPPNPLDVPMPVVRARNSTSSASQQAVTRVSREIRIWLASGGE